MVSPAVVEEVPGGSTSLLTHLSFFATFCVLLSWLMAAGVIVVRLGLPTPPRLVLTCLSVLTAAAYAPFLLSGSALGRLAQRPWALPLPTLAVLLSPVLALIVGAGLLVVYPVAAIVGAARSVRHWRGAATGPTRPQLAVLVVGPLLLSLYVFGQATDRENATVYSPEFAALGLLHSDTYFHSAVSSMIQNQGVASIGADGTRPIHYHVGSHHWFAAIGRMAGELPPYSYPFGILIVVLPALFLLLFGASRALATNDAVPAATLVLLGSGLVMLLDRVNASYFYVSESYQFGLLVLLAATPILVTLVRTVDPGARNVLTRVAVLVALVGVGFAMKISVGLILAGATGYVLVRRFRRVRVLLPAGVALAAAVVVGMLAFRDRSGVGATSFGLLDYFRTWKSYLAVSSLLVPAVVLLLLLRDRRSAADGSGPHDQRGDAGLVLVVTLLALAPALLLDLYGLAAWYFLDVAQWFALPLLLAAIPAADLNAFGRALVASRAGLAAGSLVAVVIAVPVTQAMLVPRHVAGLTRQMLEALNRTAPPGDALPVSPDSFFRTSLRDEQRLFGRAFSDALAAAYGSRTVREVRRVTRSVDDVGVFVPPENEAFWTLPRACFAAPFVIPALTGLPMVKGLPAATATTCIRPNFGFGDYPPESRTEAIGDQEICVHARAQGLRAVVVLRPGPAGGNDTSLLDCRV